MAVFAVLLAVVALLGHRTHIEQVLAQSKASDQWAYYQAKGIRRHNYEAFAELMSTLALKDEARAGQAREKFTQQAERYHEEQKEIEKEARALEHEVLVAGRKANRFNLGEVFLEIALVVTSITLLTTNRGYWMMGIAFAALGVVVAATGFLVH
jgi:Flp pilus assembly protein TadB